MRSSVKAPVKPSAMRRRMASADAMETCWPTIWLMRPEKPRSRTRHEIGATTPCALAIRAPVSPSATAFLIVPGSQRWAAYLCEINDLVLGLDSEVDRFAAVPHQTLQMGASERCRAARFDEGAFRHNRLNANRPYASVGTEAYIALSLQSKEEAVRGRSG